VTGVFVSFAVDEAGFEEQNGRRLADSVVGVFRAKMMVAVFVVCWPMNVHTMLGSKHTPASHSLPTFVVLQSPTDRNRVIIFPGKLRNRCHETRFLGSVYYQQEVKVI